MTGPSCRRLEVRFLGRIDYAAALELQLRRRDAILAGEGAEALFLLEHEEVITLGRNADVGDVLAADRWLAEQGMAVLESDRGGQVTYHGPGQLVGYPVIDLKPDRRDVRRYVGDLLEVLARTLGDFGIDATPGTRERIGLWVGEAKIASVGVHLKRWVTTHGFALNVGTDLSRFQAIVPCGLDNVSMTSLRAVTGWSLDLAAVAERCAEHFAEVFGRRLVWRGSWPQSRQAGAEPRS